MSRSSFSDRSAAFLLFLWLSTTPAVIAAAAEPHGGFQIGEFDYTRLQRGVTGRQTWNLNDLRDYAYQIERSCYCVAPSRAQVVVLGGRVVQVKDLDSGRSTADPATLASFKTIPQLFQEIDGIFAVKPDQVILELDRHLGFPARFYADPSYRRGDDEVDYRIRWVRPIVGSE